MWRPWAGCSSELPLLWCSAFPKAAPETVRKWGRPPVLQSQQPLSESDGPAWSSNEHQDHTVSFVLLLKVSVRLLSHMFAQLPLCLLQALIYPLTVASKSTTTARHNAANKILKNMCEHSNTLVQQAMMVSQEQCGLPLTLVTGPEGLSCCLSPSDSAACSLWLPERAPSISPRHSEFSLSLVFSPPLWDPGE